MKNTSNPTRSNRVQQVFESYVQKPTKSICTCSWPITLRLWLPNCLLLICSEFDFTLICSFCQIDTIGPPFERPSLETGTRPHEKMPPQKAALEGTESSFSCFTHGWLLHKGCGQVITVVHVSAPNLPVTGSAQFENTLSMHLFAAILLVFPSRPSARRAEPDHCRKLLVGSWPPSLSDLNMQPDVEKHMKFRVAALTWG